ncbi:MAG: LysE family translocator [Chloroflexota bacterium]|nr:LysE family translocator [Chloroflexota bacterium]
MLDGHFVAFLGVAGLLVVTPGVDMVLVTKYVLVNGRGAAFAAMAGIMVGHGAWAALSVAGLAALLNASATAFTALKLAGGAYLVYLGLVALWQSRDRDETAVPAVPVTAERTTGGRAFRQGLFANLLNPKAGMFYAVFLPRFVLVDDPVVLKTALLAFVFIAMVVVWLAWYIMAVGKMAGLLVRPRVRKWVDRATGTVLIALGPRLAVERR